MRRFKTLGSAVAVLALLAACQPAPAAAPTSAPKPAAPPTTAPAPAQPTAAAPKPTAAPAAKPTTAPAPAAKPAAAASPAAAAKPTTAPAAAAAPTVATTGPVADFYRGKTVRFGIGFTPGGGYDTQARLLAPVLQKYIPGNPSVVVENRPGAGSLTLANEMFATDPKDGTSFGMISENSIFGALVKAEGVNYDPLTVNWLGSPELNLNTCTIRSDAGVTSLDDMIAKGTVIKVGSTGPTSANFQFPTLLNEVLGTKFQVVPGYPGSSEILLAMEKNEVQGFCSAWVDTIRRFPEKMQSGEWIALVQNGLEKDTTNLANVPWSMDYAKTEEQKAMLRALNAAGAISKPIFAPPGVPADRVAALRTAFELTFKDPAWLNEANKQPNFIVGPKTGAQVTQVVQQLMQTPPAVVQRVQAVLEAP